MIFDTHTTLATPPGPRVPGNAPAGLSDAAIDRALIVRFVGGDEFAFTEIVARHTGKIYGVAFALLHNHADTEEITQDTFIRAHRGLVNFRGDSSLATWLYRIAVNLSRNRYWYYVRRRRPESLSLDSVLSEGGMATFAELVADPALDPAQETATGEFTSLVTLAMSRLDARHREILILRNGLNHSYAEIADALGLKVGTVKSRIARARENLRALLAALCPEFSAGGAMGGWFLPSRTGYGSPAIACA
jgi:RNA polymerase sigma-70 factor, ECF subfamily